MKAVQAIVIFIFFIYFLDRSTTMTTLAAANLLALVWNGDKELEAGDE